MPPLSNSPSPNALDTLSVEEHMRRALGLTSDSAGRSSASQPEQQRAGSQGRLAGRSSAEKPRHRFVQDGAVPVTLINRHRPEETDAPSASRAATEAALQAERTARARAERSLQEALTTVHDLQTKLGHAELAHREALDTAQAARAAADALRAEYQERELRWTQDLAAECAARTAAEAALIDAANAPGQAAQTRRPPSTLEPTLTAQGTSPALPAKVAAKRTRKAAAEPQQREPEPVKWWLKSARRRWP